MTANATGDARVRRRGRDGPLIAMMLVALGLRLLLILYFGYFNLGNEEGATRPASALLPAHFHYSFGWEVGAIAHSLASGHGFSSPFGGSTGPTAWIAPLYPALCALVFKCFGMFTPASGLVLLGLNSLFSALTCIPICRIGELCLGRRVALASGWVWAAGVTFTHWPTTWVWDIGASALLLTWLFWQTLQLRERGEGTRWARYGLWWGIAALTNPALLSVLPAFGIYAAFPRWRSGQAWLRRVLLATVVFLAILAPWLVRNRMVLGHWVFIRSNAGFEFSMANYHNSTGTAWDGRHPSANRREYQAYARLGELAYVHARGQQAWQFVRQYPREFAALVAFRCWAFWYGSFIHYSPVSVEPFPTWLFWPWSLLTWLGLIVMLVRRQPAAWLFLAAAVFYPLLYYFTVAATRFRHALEPLMLLASMYFVLGAAADIASHFCKPGIRRAAAGGGGE
jgi:4-amino-4-deoxy-L-arabinose transferase-like glycosyltransferase